LTGGVEISGDEYEDFLKTRKTLLGRSETAAELQAAGGSYGQVSKGEEATGGKK